MRLLVHTPFFHPQVGGVETFADGLAAELAGRGWEVRVVAEAPLGTAPELTRTYRVVRPPYTAVDLLAETDVLLAVGPSTRLLAAARRAGVPAVLVHQAPAAACPVGIGWRDGRSCDYRLTKCLGCRVVGQSPPANVRHVARMHLLRRGMRRAAANVYISEYLAGRTPLCPGEVIGNFYDPAVFAPAAGVGTEPAFLFVGRLVSIKGVDVAVRGLAVARRRGLRHRLKVVGDGPERSALERLVAKEGVGEAVDFLGGHRGESLAGLYRSAYALLFPSQWEEPFGMVMAEAMGSGCPVIASAHGACPEVVGDTGWLVSPPADPSAWADAMLAAVADTPRRDGLAAAAADRSGRLFGLPVVADRYARLLSRVANNRGGDEHA